LSTNPGIGQGKPWYPDTVLVSRDQVKAPRAPAWRKAPLIFDSTIDQKQACETCETGRLDDTTKESRTCLSRSLLLLLCLHGLAAAETWPASGDKPTARCRKKRRSEANLFLNHVIIYLAHDESRSVRWCGCAGTLLLATWRTRTDGSVKRIPRLLCIYLQLQLF
jgi:hypothetical protein